tara:strand:+ start:514 stop:771 length:258 start_codon:yes stop_codon:yes gene_type:complete
VRYHLKKGSGKYLNNDIQNAKKNPYELSKVHANSLQGISELHQQLSQPFLRRRIVLQVRRKRGISQLIWKAPPQTLRRPGIIAQP